MVARMYILVNYHENHAQNCNSSIAVGTIEILRLSVSASQSKIQQDRHLWRTAPAEQFIALQSPWLRTTDKQGVNVINIIISSSISTVAKQFGDTMQQTIHKANY